MLSLLSPKPNENKRKLEDDTPEPVEKRAKIEIENGFPHDNSNILSREEMAPLFVECIKQEQPDFPFMESLDEDHGQITNCTMSQQDFDATNELLTSNLELSMSAIEPPQQNIKKPKSSRKRKTIASELCLQDPSDDLDYGTPTEIVVDEDASFIETKDSSFTEEVRSISGGKNNKEAPAITTRVLKRVNLIIQAVQQHTVIDDLTKLLKLIQEEEEKEGMNTKIDRKSLHRLLEKLNKDGHIKTIRVHMKGATKEKTLNFICQPNITVDHSIIQSALDQAKIKMYIPDAKLNSTSINQSMDEMSALESSFSTKTPTFKRSGKLGKQYGYQPKFVRMKTMHKLLFYVIHDYAGVSDLDQQSVKETLNDITPLSPELEKEMPHVFFPAVDWRMFIPPLPQHSGWPKGWAIMCDILLRLPLSIFLHLVNINYEVAGLEEYLSHPIRKHYLLKHLPPAICYQLTAARRYIFNCHEVVTRLCYIGLVQFGPQKLKDKDQVFFYLNKNSSLLDTTTTSVGYHQISGDMDYKVLRFNFASFRDVDQYWYQMWNICVNTPLGGRMCMVGKEITLEVLENKPAMEASLQPRSPEDAVLLDVGDVPGDHLGAAGLDSAMFAHLKRNWNWFNHVSDSDIDGTHTPVVNDHLPQAKTSKKKVVTLGVKSQIKSAEETLSPRNFVPRKPDKNEAPKPALERKKRSSRQNEVRKVPMPKASKRKPYYDETDIEALTLMSKLRVEWTGPEDNILLLCKVASAYLSPTRSPFISMQLWRDLLHKLIEKSKNKTSRAVQRRIQYMMKNPSTARSVTLCLEEIKQDTKISKEFGNLIPNLKAKEEKTKVIEKIVNEKFVKLVDILLGRFQNMRSNSVAFERALIPDTIEELRSSYVVASPQENMSIKKKFTDVVEVGDIHLSVINAMIYSSLCCLSDKTSYAYQLFKVYQQYPDALLRSTMAKIRADQMVSLRKAYTRTKARSGQFLPVSNCPYQLSISYQYLLLQKFQYEIYHESFVTLQKLAWDMLLNTDVNGLEFLVVDGGATATFIEYITMDKLNFQITIPDQLIILDPRISGTDQTYTRIVQRYRDILRKCHVSRDIASKSTKADLSASEKPFVDILSRDDVWESKDEETISALDQNAQNEKNNAATDLSSTPTTSLSKKNNHEKKVEEDLSDSEDEEKAFMPSLSTPQCAVARAATRIALYMMREENESSEVGVFKETQHAHDFFVVNSCKVVCRLKEDISTDAPTEALVGIDPKGSRIKCAVSRSLLPVNAALASEVLEDIKTKAVFVGPTLSEDEVLATLVSKGYDGPLMKSLLLYVASKNEFGATMADIRAMFGNFKPILSMTLKALVDEQIFLRAGVTKLVLVHYKKVRPWLIHSKKLLRLDREKLTPTDCKVLALAEEKDGVASGATDDNILEIEGIGEVVPEEPIEDADDDVEQEEAEEVDGNVEESVDDPVQSVQNKTDEPSTVLPDLKKGSKKALHLRNSRTKRGVARLQEGPLGSLNEMDNIQSDKIRVSIRPWIRVDGSVNRRVLDRLLGSVLGYCMSEPGCSLEGVGERFSPGLQPFHSRELCEILQKLGCIQWSTIYKSHKPTLFSKRRTISQANADGTENECDISLEASPDAIIRLGLFIGDKAYKKDFLSGI